MTSTVSWPWVLDGSPEEHDLWDKLETMTRRPAERLLRSLAERADAGGPIDVQCYALCLAVLGRTAEAVRAWEELLSVRPQSVASWFNLGKALVLEHRRDQAITVLERCRAAMVDHPGVRARVDERLAELQAAQAEEDDERRWRELQVAAIRWRLENGQAQPGDRRRLVPLLYGLMMSPGNDVARPEVLAAARAAYAEAPSDPATLEIVAAVLLDCGTDEELNTVLRTLEDVLPHSEVLEHARRTSRDDPEINARAKALQRRHEELIVRAMQGAADAEPEIRGRLRWLPDNVELRIALMYAIHARGDTQKALRMADQMAAELEGEHLMHFYVGQLLWNLDRHGQARHHFARALATARDESDRADVHKMMQVVGAVENPGNG